MNTSRDTKDKLKIEQKSREADLLPFIFTVTGSSGSGQGTLCEIRKLEDGVEQVVRWKRETNAGSDMACI
jgi:hypothetical protein